MVRANWTEVFRTGDDVEAELVRALLEANGFPVVVEAKGQKAIPAIFGTTANGELILRVPPDMADQAIELLNAETEEEPT